MQLQLLLAALAAAAETEDVLVTDVIRFYDQPCWAKHCDADIVACIASDPRCGRHFTPLPQMFAMTPKDKDRSSVTAVPADEADEGGGPMLGFEGVRWKDLSASELSVIACAKQHSCAPTAATVTEDDALVKASESKAAPSSFLEVGQAEAAKVLEQMGVMKSQASSMEQKLHALNGAKASVSQVANMHQSRMKQLEEMQIKGVAAVQSEKQFVAQSRARLAAAQTKLAALAEVKEPNEESFLELSRTQAEMRAVRAEMASHFTSFAKDFPLPRGLASHDVRAAEAELEVGAHMRAD